MAETRRMLRNELAIIMVEDDITGMANGSEEAERNGTCIWMGKWASSKAEQTAATRTNIERRDSGA